MRIAKLVICALLISIAALTFAACGGGSSQPSATATKEPPTPFPTFAFVEPTNPPVFDQTSTETPASDVGESALMTLDPKEIDRGRGRYEALECGSCHGENGAGADGGKSLLDFVLLEDDFITFMRTGGDLGPSHQFSTDRLSNSGSRNLFQYLVSIAVRG